MPPRFHFTQSPADPNAASQPARPEGESAAASDLELLDAYSRAVIGVVEGLGPTVICIEPPRGENRGGAGSGVLLTPDGYALTNSHVANGRRKLTAVTEEGDRLDAELVGDERWCVSPPANCRSPSWATATACALANS
jgi:S1-C subfamily serine protease